MENRPLLALSSEQLDLWAVLVDETYDPALVRRYRDLLSAEELEQEKRFYFAKDRHCYLVTRALVRDVLSRYASIPPRDWKFAPSEYGRPMIANRNAVAKRISFNISHTDGLILLGVIRDRALGVDAENVTREAPIQLADSYFSPSETEALRRLPTSEQQRRFFDLWTLKESYIKARGMGLAIPLTQFGFKLDSNDRILAHFERDFGDSPSKWLFWQWHPSAHHSAAVCLESAGGASCLLVMRKVVPLLADVTIDVESVRTSGKC